MILRCFCLTVFLALSACPATFALSPVVVPEPVAVPADESRAWVRYVVPLPKSISIPAKVVLPKSVPVVANAADPVTKQARKELAEVLGAGAEAAFTVKLQIGGAESEPLRRLPNNDQAYRILPGAANKGLKLVALHPRGIYYAAKTLQQLLNARATTSRVEIPLLTVTDWPDMQDRGLWGSDSFIRLKWMADRKMNLVEQISYLVVDEKGRGHASHKEGRETMSNEAPLYGMKPVPAILHLDQVGGKGLFAAYPELRGIGGEENAMCYSKPDGIVTVLTDWMVDLKKLPGVEEVDCWMAENLHGKGGCKCEECKKTDRSVKEARVILEAWKRAQEKVGPFGLRMSTSEETGSSNALIMKELPERVKLYYYHSLFTYNSSQVPMIPKEVSDYAARGKWAGVVPSLCAWVNYLEPFTGAHFVRSRIDEFVSKKLSGLMGYATPRIDYVRFNTEAAAEWSWNSKGRSTREFALSFAVREGFKDPELFAEWSETMGPVAWDVYGSEWPACEKRRYPGQVAELLRAGKLPELGSNMWGAFRGPWGDIRDEQELKADVANAAKGLRLARQMGMPVYISESLAVDGYIRALAALYELKRIVKPEGVATGDKPIAATHFREYIDGMRQAAAALPAWELLIQPDATDLFVEPSLKLVNRSIDQMKQLAADLGLKLD